MFHYTYLLRFNNGMLYHGVNSSDNPWSLGYTGSGTNLPYLNKAELIVEKEVLTIHDTREQAEVQERNFQIEHQLSEDPQFYNVLKTVNEFHPSTLKERVIPTTFAWDKSNT